jgi:hypothetical protein
MKESRYNRVFHSTGICLLKAKFHAAAMDWKKKFYEDNADMEIADEDKNALEAKYKEIFRSAIKVNQKVLT